MYLKDVPETECVAIVLYDSAKRSRVAWHQLPKSERDKWRTEARKMIREASDEEWERDF